MVQQTKVLFGKLIVRHQREVWKRKGVYVVARTPARLELTLQEKGKRIVKASDVVNPPKKAWVPDNEVLMPDFRWNFPKDSLPNPPEKSQFSLSTHASFTEGLNQACILTKSQRFDGLPSAILENIDKYSIKDQNHLVQRLIMKSQVWDPTYEKLPRRSRDRENPRWKFNREWGIPDSRSASVLLNGLIQLCQTMAGQYPALSTDRMLLYKPSIQTKYQYKGDDIVVNAINECMVHGTSYLPPFGDKTLIEKSVDHEMLDMFPVLPTIDLLYPGTLYTDIKGAVEDPSMLQFSKPLSVFRLMTLDKPENNQAYNLILTFAIAYTEALNRYGVIKRELEQPITVLNINCTHSNYNFLCFQLNTMDISNDSGIKNFVWSDINNPIFRRQKCQPWKEVDKKWKPPTYHDYDSAVFKKFLAMYMHGIQ